MNECRFSKDRKYRYLLTHEWDELLPRKEIAWIGLNPSTADEEQLDPTLRRIKSFSASMGYNVFHMLNLFAFRATDPADMKKIADPVGPENDYWIKEICKNVTTVGCWGSHGTFLRRGAQVCHLLKNQPIYCLGTTKDESPRHPLYLPSNQKLEVYL